MSIHTFKMPAPTLKWLADGLLTATSQDKHSGALQHARFTITSGQCIAYAGDRFRVHEMFVDVDPSVPVADGEFTIHRDALKWAAKNAMTFKPQPGAMLSPVAVFTAEVDGNGEGTVTIDIREWDDDDGAQHVQYDGPTVEGPFPDLRHAIRRTVDAKEGKPAPISVASIGDTQKLHTFGTVTPVIKYVNERRITTALLQFWAEGTLRARAAISTEISEGGAA